jgi:hypothetical protein
MHAHCHIGVSTESEMGHMNQSRQGICSTQPKIHTPMNPNTSKVHVPPNLHTDNHMADAPQEPHNICTNIVFMQIHIISGIISSNQTGWFPITSNCGHAYVAVFYIFDANYVRSVPIKNRSKKELLRAYQEIYKWLTQCGFKSLLHKLDNKTSHDMEAFVKSQHTHLQYTPSNIHRTNPAERAIQTWKNHFLVGIAGLPKSFPVANWC